VHRSALEVQDVEFSKVYRWCPANVSVECICGEEPTLSAFRTICGGWRAVIGKIRGFRDLPGSRGTVAQVPDAS
jgi:hypothetical protein